MPMKTKDNDEEVRKFSSTVINLEKRKKKPSSPYCPGLLVEQRISAASKISIANAVNAMYLPISNNSINPPLIAPSTESKGGEKKGDNPLSGIISSTQMSSNDNNRFIYRNSRNKFKYVDDQPLCQDQNERLSLWLKAYCPIPNNFCKWPVDVETQLRFIQKTRRSMEKREELGRDPFLSNGGERHWRITKSGKLIHAVLGYPSGRPPTLVQLLVRAYEKGFSFKKAASKVNTIVPEALEPSPPTLSYEDHWNFREKEKKKEVCYSFSEYCHMMTSSCYDDEEKNYYWWFCKAAFRGNERLAHLKDDKLQPLYSEQVDMSQYQQWLLSREIFNPHVDFEDRSVFVNGTVSTMGCRYEGRKAAEFAPIERYRKITSPFGDIQWRKYLCYYQRYRQGDIDEVALRQAAKFIWGNDPYFSKRYIDRLKYDAVYPGRHRLPTPENIDKFLEGEREKETKAFVNFILVNDGEKESNQKLSGNFTSDNFDRYADKPHPSGHSHDEVYHLSLARAWKKLPDMLTLVPETYDVDKGQQIILLDGIDKLDRLKTG